jgi:hypothetical protein
LSFCFQFRKDPEEETKLSEEEIAALRNEAERILSDEIKNFHSSKLVLGELFRFWDPLDLIRPLWTPKVRLIAKSNVCIESNVFNLLNILPNFIKVGQTVIMK